jgi:adenosylcobyric acid synthase
LRYGGRLIGICGGFQMLGRGLSDPLGLEGAAGDAAGFGWFDFDTVLDSEKQLRNVSGTLQIGGVPVSGYEIHAGVSRGPALRRPSIVLDSGRSDGALSTDGQIIGAYLHGLFEHPEACAALLRWMGLADPQPLDYARVREQAIDRVADAVETHLQLPTLLGLLGSAA